MGAGSAAGVPAAPAQVGLWGEWLRADRPQNLETAPRLGLWLPVRRGGCEPVVLRREGPQRGGLAGWPQPRRLPPGDCGRRAHLLRVSPVAAKVVEDPRLADWPRSVMAARAHLAGAAHTTGHHSSHRL